MVQRLILAAALGALAAAASAQTAPADDGRWPAVHSRVPRDPAIEARVTSATPLPLGQEVTVRLAAADPVKRMVRFELAG